MDMFSQPMPLVMQVGRMVDGLSLVTHQQIHLHNLFELQIIKILFSGETTSSDSVSLVPLEILLLPLTPRSTG